MITLLLNATILTMDRARPEAEALAIRGEYIAAVGARDDVLGLRERDSELIDLGGRTVLPGFVDPHNHFSIGALECFWADCRATHGASRTSSAGCPRQRAASRTASGCAASATTTPTFPLAVTRRASISTPLSAIVPRS